MSFQIRRGTGLSAGPSSHTGISSLFSGDSDDSHSGGNHRSGSYSNGSYSNRSHSSGSTSSESDDDGTPGLVEDSDNDDPPVPMADPVAGTAGASASTGTFCPPSDPRPRWRPYGLSLPPSTDVVPDLLPIPGPPATLWRTLPVDIPNGSQPGTVNCIGGPPPVQFEDTPQPPKKKPLTPRIGS